MPYSILKAQTILSALEFSLKVLPRRICCLFSKPSWFDINISFKWPTADDSDKIPGLVFINSLPPGKFFMLFCRLIFFKINFFEKFFQEYHLSVKQIGSRLGPTLSGLVWVQSVCKSYQQRTLGEKNKKKYHRILCLMQL